MCVTLKTSDKGQFSVDEVPNEIDVMLVEDNPLLLTLVSKMIKSYPVTLIGAALTYEESLKIFNEHIWSTNTGCQLAQACSGKAQACSGKAQACSGKAQAKLIWLSSDSCTTIRRAF
jgi:hypothetical protein